MWAGKRLNRFMVENIAIVRMSARPLSTEQGFLIDGMFQSLSAVPHSKDQSEHPAIPSLWLCVVNVILPVVLWVPSTSSRIKHFVRFHKEPKPHSWRDSFETIFCESLAVLANRCSLSTFLLKHVCPLPVFLVLKLLWKLQKDK